MIIVMDERRSVSLRQPHPSGNAQRFAIDMKVLALADFVCIVKDDTYEVIKDRYTGETQEFPIDELPDLIKNRLVMQIKQKDQVSTDE